MTDKTSHGDDRRTQAANDAEREAQVTQIIVRLERLLAEAAKLREELARLTAERR